MFQETPPHEALVDESSEASRGAINHDAEHYKLEMSNPGERQQDFRKLRMRSTVSSKSVAKFAHE